MGMFMLIGGSYVLQGLVLSVALHCKCTKYIGRYTCT